MCAQEYQKLGEAYMACEELVVQGDIFLKGLKETLVKQMDQIDLLEKQLVAERERVAEEQAWYKDPMLWSVIGFAIGVGVTIQIDK